jgi:hypothetical protein
MLDANVVEALLVNSIAIFYPKVVWFTAAPSNTLVAGVNGYKVLIILATDDTLTTNDFNRTLIKLKVTIGVSVTIKSAM